MELVVNLVFSVRPEPDLSRLHDNDIAVDGPGVDFSEGGALEVDGGVEEGKGGICGIEIGEEEGLVGVRELVSDRDGRLLIHLLVGGVAERIVLAPSVSVVAVVEVVGLAGDEDEQAEQEDWHLHYSNALIILLNSGHYSISTREHSQACEEY